MTASSSLRTFALLLAVFSSIPAAAWAQRNGDVSNGFNNQPSSGEVRTRERAAGVAPPPAEQRAQTKQVDTIYNQLMGGDKSAGSAGPGGSAVTPLQPGPVAPSQ